MTEADKKPACPECGEPASGNFCQECGASLGGRFCNQCGAKLAADAKFCSECGAQAGGRSAPAAHAAGGASRTPPAARARAPRGARVAPDGRREAAAATVGGQNLPWWIAGIAMFGMIFLIGLNMVRPGPREGPTPGGAAATTVSGTAPDISQMTPLEAADRLFNRVMQSVSAGDSTQAQAFLPMAIAAYQRARPLTADGLFHLSLLNRTAFNVEAALDNAMEILDQDPNHLLGLAAAAEAETELGELDAAADHYRRILDNLDSERARGLEEYQMHSQIVDGLQQEARAFLAGRG